VHASMTHTLGRFRFDLRAWVDLLHLLHISPWSLLLARRGDRGALGALQYSGSGSSLPPTKSAAKGVGDYVPIGTLSILLLNIGVFAV